MLTVGGSQPIRAISQRHKNKLTLFLKGFEKWLMIMDYQRWLEWTGVGTAILYSMLIAFNIGAEFIGFVLLLLSSGLIGLWAYFGSHRGIMLLQLFYATAGVIGMIRWL